ncbi:MAG: glutamine synthetase III [Lentisphaeria bacterium]|nr:glutamine synthetase III [Lentisphaeria bacterium]
MNNFKRSEAIRDIADLKPEYPKPAEAVHIDYYGEDVFHANAIRQYLPSDTAQKLLATINEGSPLDSAIAGDVAHAMKEWALARGATHYTHWFQPLTGGTAEKHDAFLEASGQALASMSFSGKNLIVSEPDASSFPSGGLRCTFEARGYTAWDPSSPAFIKRHANGATLCIPTAFCSYTGAALDKKTPLLRSLQALNKAVQRFMRLFDYPVSHTRVALGIEQEYFLIDKKFYLQRPDLLQTGRTLFGAAPPKHQQLEDHYFGAIKPRILRFMTEVETELWRLGIPARTRHNEVAPAQFELAPMHEDLNLAIDHNMLIMEVLRQVADRNSLVCLLHEKPFAGVNGSGKHNNWSLSYAGCNLLEPGRDPQQNAIFLSTLCAVIRAVDLHADLLRAASASAGNDLRLGANEAPPAVISVFLGEQLSEILEQLGSGNNGTQQKPGKMRIGVDILPPLPKDATDRNRTSPLAFTGNKFELRFPGASQSSSGVNVIFNTIVAESLDYISTKLEKTDKADFNRSLQILLRELMREHKRVIFNGDNYSEAWLEEARKRGLPILPSTMQAIQSMKEQSKQQVFIKYAVYSAAELESRFEVCLEEYHRKIRIEGEIGLEIARSMLIPVVADEYSRLANALKLASQDSLSAGVSGLRRSTEELGRGLDQLYDKCDALAKALQGLHEDIIAALQELRKVVDALEYRIDDRLWPLPKYREMLFIY